MYISKIKLENVSGIYAGLGMDKLKIKFDDERFNIINLICGTNGSGKSTLLKSLTPFATEVIRTGEHGLKEILYEKKKWTVKITHRYTPKSNGGHTTKSFIVKESKLDGEIIDLNPNGNVSTFLDAVENELGITPAKMKLLQLGNDMTNLLKMTSTERKKYITEFTSDVDIYLEKFKKVSSDFITVKKMLENVGYNLNKLGNIESLNDELKSVDGSIDIYNKNLIDITGKLSNLEDAIKEYSSYEKYTKGHDVYLEALAIQQSLNEKYGNLTNKTDVELASMKGDIDKNVLLIETNVANLSSKITELTNNCEKLDKDNLAIDNKLLDIKYEKIDNLKELIKSYITDIRQLETKINNTDLNVSDIDLSFVEMIENECKQYRESLNALFDHVDIVCLSDLEKINYRESVKKLDNDYSKINSKKQLLLEKNQILSNEKNTLIKDTFTFTDMCKNCPRFGSMYTSSNDYDRIIEENTENIMLLDNDLIHLERERELLRVKNDIFNIFGNILNMINNYLSMDKNKSLMLSFNNESISVNDILDKIKAGNSNIFNFERIDFYKKIIVWNNRLTELQNKLNNLKLIAFNNEKYDELVATKTSNIETIKSMEQEKINYNNELERYNEIKDSLMQHRALIDEYVQHRSNISNIDTLKEEYDKYNDYKLYYQNSLCEREKYTHILESEIKPNIEKLTNMRDKIVSNINEYNKLIKQKQILEDYYMDIEITKRALSPNKGIPLKSINSYLQKTRHIANQLLKEAFDGELMLDEFVIDEKEFKIPVCGKGDGVDDASKCSSGERALITLAISLAMYKQNNTKYNILSLDELDGPLDEDKRRKFLHLLELQIQHLNISQVFNITHNNMFNDVLASIVLLKGAKVDNFIDKKILFKF